MKKILISAALLFAASGSVQAADGKAVVEKVSFFNMLGKLVHEELNPLTAIDLKQLPLGMHLVKIETNQGTLHKTILKK